MDINEKIFKLKILEDHDCMKLDDVLEFINPEGLQLFDGNLIFWQEFFKEKYKGQESWYLIVTNYILLGSFLDIKFYTKRFTKIEEKNHFSSNITFLRIVLFYNSIKCMKILPVYTTYIPNQT